MDENSKKRPLVLIADDDEDDFELWKKAFSDASGSTCDFRWAENGVRLVDYMKRQNGFEDPADSPKPDLILLDLNMPFMDGRQALREIKASEDWSSIPVVAMTLSTNPEDAKYCYKNGASSVINKPFGLEQTRKLFENLSRYWFQTVRLPEP